MYEREKSLEGSADIELICGGVVTTFALFSRRQLCPYIFVLKQGLQVHSLFRRKKELPWVGP